VGVVHQSKGLLLGFKASDHTLGIHAGLDDFQGDLSPDRLMLLSKVNDAHTALAQDPQQLIAADLRADPWLFCIPITNLLTIIGLFGIYITLEMFLHAAVLLATLWLALVCNSFGVFAGRHVEPARI
jgi:hypothetical protein